MKSGDYLSSRQYLASTFGVRKLNFCVRNGNRWILSAIITTMVIYCGFSFRHTYVFCGALTLSCVVLRANLLVKRRFTTTQQLFLSFLWQTFPLARKNYRVFVKRFRLKSFVSLFIEIKPSTYQYRSATHIAALPPPTYQPCRLQGVLLTFVMGYLILRRVSRLDAFSVYLNRTPLPCYAAGATTGAQLVRSSRSSRTKDKPSQISYAHDGQGPNCLTTF